jgi:hypothetical protein
MESGFTPRDMESLIYDNTPDSERSAAAVQEKQEE